MEMEEMKDQEIEVKSAGILNLAEGKSAKAFKPYPHQEEAFEAMDKKILNIGIYPYKGLLVLPTGAGKTLTAACWIAKNILDKGIKVLWIAHRHELLNQAKRTFIDILGNSYYYPTLAHLNWRILSGSDEHDSSVNIKPSDNLIISSKDSLRSDTAQSHLVEWLNDADEIFMVVDEAHHASAKTYRKLIEFIENHVSRFRLLGLTATPIRTSEKEQGYLHKIFPDDIVYSIDLKSLIRKGILSEPIFESVDTKEDFTNVFTDEQIEKLNSGFSRQQLESNLFKTINKNGERNNCIVNRYINNQAKYGKTIIFAQGTANAIALQGLFHDKHIKSDIVLSLRDSSGYGSNYSAEENKKKIQLFKEGELDVLINVEILTEGVDVPSVQTVFLTRPTMSKILMTQMIGRGLRGVDAGGTPKTYIVSFIDHWDERIMWVNPEKLYTEDGIDFNDMDSSTQKRIVRLIALNKIEEFAILCDDKIDNERKKLIQSVDFYKRIPKGIMHFTYPYGDDARDCDILVYDNLEGAYKMMLRDFPRWYDSLNINSEDLTESLLEGLAQECEFRYFNDVDRYPAYSIKDLENIVGFYAQTGEIPTYHLFEERAQYDINKIAEKIDNEGWGERQKREYLNELWNKEQSVWQALFGIENHKLFMDEVNTAINKLYNPEDYEIKVITPEVEYEKRKYEDISLPRLREIDSTYAQWLTEKVFSKNISAYGRYKSASGYESPNRYEFEIDHIVPLDKGGKTVLENLQLLTRRENKEKGTKLI